MNIVLTLTANFILLHGELVRDGRVECSSGELE